MTKTHASHPAVQAAAQDVPPKKDVPPKRIVPLDVAVPFLGGPSSSGTQTLPVWLCSLATPAVRVPTRVALVEAPMPLPPLVSYLGLTYVWSRVYWCYIQTAAQAVGVSARTDKYASHVAEPQF